jgi:hypothetical protein
MRGSSACKTNRGQLSSIDGFRDDNGLSHKKRQSIA